MTEQQLAAIWLSIFNSAIQSPLFAPTTQATEDFDVEAVVETAAEIADRGAKAFFERVKAKKS